MPEMLAWRTNSGAGGNTRLSVNTDSIMDDILMDSSWIARAHG